MHPLRTRPHATHLAAAAVALAVALAPPRARAEDTWTTPFPGVRRLYRTTSTPWRIHALVVNLCAAGVSVRATAPSERRRTTSSFGTLVRAEAAINGDLFSYTDYSTSGLAVGNGMRWADTADNTTQGLLAFGPGRAELSPPSELVSRPPAWMDQVVGGRPQIVAGGAALSPTGSPSCATREPRTAAGLSRDRRTLYLAVVDGRSSSSAGMTCGELGAFMRSLGAHDALNLDGGGSSTMWLRGPGVVNNPSGGSERVVANHLAIQAAGAGLPVSCDPSVDEVLYQIDALQSGGTTDINGDGRADVCARGAAGVRCALGSDGGALGAAVTGPALSDASGWTAPSTYSTLRMGDINGDGRADVCARAHAGVLCWLSDGAGFPTRVDGPDLSTATNWDELRYYSTLRLADIDADGRDDLCARGAAGLRCWRSTGGGFSAAVAGPALSDAEGWDEPRYYGTLRMGDVNGDGRADVCARGAAGVSCWLSNGAGFPTRVAGPAWSDASGYDHVAYWSTLRLADVNGDRRADLCVRTATDFRCHLSTGAGFGPAVVGPALSDAGGWGQHSRYSTLRLADLDGDGDLDLCGRSAAGIMCWRWNGSDFGAAIDGPDLSDAAGWGAPEHYRTIRWADVTGDGREDLCARAAAGVFCWPSTGAGFGARITGPAWSDATGWDAPIYYSTLRAAGPRCVRAAETCNGRDDDCDGMADEGCGLDGGAADAMVADDVVAGEDVAAIDDVVAGDDAAAVDDVVASDDAAPDDAPSAGDATDGASLGGDGDGVVQGGCGCRATGHRRSAPGAPLLTALIALGAARRRRRAGGRAARAARVLVPALRRDALDAQGPRQPRHGQSRPSLGRRRGADPVPPRRVRLRPDERLGVGLGVLPRVLGRRAHRRGAARGQPRPAGGIRFVDRGDGRGPVHLAPIFPAETPEVRVEVPR